MSEAKGPWWGRVLIVLFSVAIIAIASHQISKKYTPKRVAKNPLSKEELLEEFQGDIDVAKASVSPDYIEKYARKPSDSEANAKNSKDSNSTSLDSHGLKNLLDRLSP